MSSGIKNSIFRIVDITTPGDKVSKAFDIFILTLIVLSLVSVIVETTDYGEKHYRFFEIFEALSVFIFSIEYILRLWTCTEYEDYKNPLLGRLRYMLTLLMIIDFFAIAPFFLPMFITLDLRFLRILRLLRVFRVLKVVRYNEGMQTFGKMLSNQKEELIIALTAVIMLIIISSCLMYNAEHNAQPEAFSSIPVTFWWAVCTLTTVGYGDVYPVTHIGKLLSSVISILGIGVFALPAGILAAGLIEVAGKNKQPTMKCPKCGYESHE